MLEETRIFAVFNYRAKTFTDNPAISDWYIHKCFLKEEQAQKFISDQTKPDMFKYQEMSMKDGWSKLCNEFGFDYSDIVNL